jgi:hypothetical protein
MSEIVKVLESSVFGMIVAGLPDREAAVSAADEAMRTSNASEDSAVAPSPPDGRMGESLLRYGQALHDGPVCAACFSWNLILRASLLLLCGHIAHSSTSMRLK